MPRDPALLAESAALQRELVRYPTLAALRSSRGWAALAPRLERLLATVRRCSPATLPAPPADPTRLRAIHWNIEHGNWYEQVEQALLHHPDLAKADLLLMNEVDLGMARAGNRDVACDLAAALGLHAAWAPLFLETTLGRDDDPRMAAGRENQESLLGLAVLSRFPLGATRIVDLPGPEELQFRDERMYGRHAALAAEVLRPGAPFVAVSVHLEVHRTRAHRAAEVHVLMEALREERRPIVLAGDFNAHTFDRGLPHSALAAAAALFLSRRASLDRRLLHPDEGRHREPLFEELARAGFEWRRFVDYAPTLGLRFNRVGEARAVPGALAPLAEPLLAWAERRTALRLDWFAGRGWRGGRGLTVPGLDGPGRASDHAPLTAEFGL